MLIAADWKLIGLGKLWGISTEWGPTEGERGIAQRTDSALNDLCSQSTSGRYAAASDRWHSFYVHGVEIV